MMDPFIDEMKVTEAVDEASKSQKIYCRLCHREIEPHDIVRQINAPAFPDGSKPRVGCPHCGFVGMHSRNLSPNRHTRRSARHEKKAKT